jgi:hypothetical protein
MELTAALAQMAPGYEAGETEYLNREGVMELVTRWRMKWDAASKSDVESQERSQPKHYASYLDALHATAREAFEHWVASAGAEPDLEHPMWMLHAILASPDYRPQDDAASAIPRHEEG